MHILRLWATPLIIGTFLLMSVTGILMFFHWDMGLNKTAHEWLGWALVIAAVAHVTINFPSFRRHFKRPVGGILIAFFAILLGLSFFSLPGTEETGGVRPLIESLTKAPLINLAPLAHATPQEIADKLTANNISVTNPETDTPQSLSHGNQNQEMKILNLILIPEKK